MSVSIKPLPSGFRSIAPRLWCQHPPIFPDGEPSRDDIALAIELIEALDDESRAWYARSLEHLRDRLADA